MWKMVVTMCVCHVKCSSAAGKECGLLKYRSGAYMHRIFLKNFVANAAKGGRIASE